MKQRKYCGHSNQQPHSSFHSCFLQACPSSAECCTMLLPGIHEIMVERSPHQEKPCMKKASDTQLTCESYFLAAELQIF